MRASVVGQVAVGGQVGQEVGGGCVHTGGSGHVGGAVATAVVGHGS